MEIWISSDLHLDHLKIIEYCNRPFADQYEMTEKLITWHNELVKPEDHWYHLGDCTMARGSLGSTQAQRFIGLIKRMNGHKRLILGNHDHFPPKVYLEAGFEKIVGTGQWLDNMILSHYPVHPASLGRSKGCIHGHCHGQDDISPLVTETSIQPYLNVCVERIDYRPITLGECKERLAKISDRVLQCVHDDKRADRCATTEGTEEVERP